MIKKFEYLEIWKEARELSRRIFEITSSGPGDYKFRDQIRAAAGSCMDNIAEGFERDGNKEFYQFLSISKGSTGEVRSQSYRAYDAGYIPEDIHMEILERTDKLSRKIHNFMQHLKSSEYKGLKYT